MSPIALSLGRDYSFPFQSVQPLFESIIVPIFEECRAKMTDLTSTSDKRNNDDFEEPELVNEDFEFANMVNAILVWTGVRPAALCAKFHGALLVKCLDSLNDISKRLSSGVPTVVIRPFTLDRGEIAGRPRGEYPQFLITREDTNVHFMGKVVTREELGLALGMYHINVKQFTRRVSSSFRIKVAGTIVGLYQEVYCRKHLKDSEFQEFKAECEAKVTTWNTSMENLRWEYHLESMYLRTSMKLQS
jgi:hypothetical protein